jgi:hypothetical protein
VKRRKEWQAESQGAFLNKCVAELNRHPIRFRSVKAVGVQCGDVIGYCIDRRYRTGRMPTPFNVLRSFERKLRKQLTGLSRRCVKRRKGWHRKKRRLEA